MDFHGQDCLNGDCIYKLLLIALLFFYQWLFHILKHEFNEYLQSLVCGVIWVFVTIIISPPVILILYITNNPMQWYMHSYVMNHLYSERVSQLKRRVMPSDICLIIPETGIMLFTSLIINTNYNLSATNHYYMKEMLQKGHKSWCDGKAESSNTLWGNEIFFVTLAS